MAEVARTVGSLLDPVLRLFPACPKEWDASFKLAARGAFIVRSSVESGEVRRGEFLVTRAI